MTAINDNEIDICLLEENMPALIDKYQNKIKYIVHKARLKGWLIHTCEEDMVQEVKEKLLLKKGKMSTQYQHKASVRTYLGTVVYNICRMYFRSEKRKIACTTLEEWEVNEYSLCHTKNEQAYINLIIKEELQHLKTVLASFKKQQAKLMLCLKLICRLPLRAADFRKCYPSSPEIYINKMLAILGENYQQKTDKEIYGIVTCFSNMVNFKQVSVEAIKKWIEEKIKQIITALNSFSGVANYDKEALKILITKGAEQDFFTEIKYFTINQNLKNTQTFQRKCA